MKLSYISKRNLLLLGIVVIGIGVASLVSQKNASADEVQDTSSSSSAELVLGTPNPISAPPVSSGITGTSSAFVPSSGAEASEALTESSKPASTPPAPTPPASSELTNKAKKPTYSSKPTPAVSSKVASKAPSGGKSGEIYVPGFGWQKPTGGEMSEASDMYEDGVKVGIMD